MILVCSVFLFCYGKDGYQSIVDVKFHVFLWIFGGYILLMAVIAVECVIVGELRIKPVKSVLRDSSWPQRFVVLYMALTWISAFLSPYFPQTVVGVSRYEGALTITIYCICFLLVSTFGKPSKLLLWCIGIAATAFGIIAVFQFVGWNPLSLYPAGYTYYDSYTSYAGAYLGTIGNIDLVAAFLCVVVPLLWIGLLRLTGKARFLLLIPLGVSLLIQFKMSVMAGIVGIIVGSVLSLPVVLPTGKRNRMRIAWGVWGLLAAAAAALFFVDFGTGMLHEAHEILNGNWEDSFGSGRIHIWKEVLAQVPQNLFLGMGPDTMLYAELEPFTQYHDAVSTMVVSQIDAAHNEYLNILYHQGILSLATYLVFLGLEMKRWIKRGPTDPVAAMLGGAALAYGIQAFFGISMCITAPFFWIALALLESRSRKE